MRAVVTRVSSASVRVADRIVGEIGPESCVLLGVASDDDERAADTLAKKIYDLRIFDDATGAMNRSLAEVGGAILVVSQFTLLGDARRGRRPSFVDAARPERGRELYERVVRSLRTLGAPVATGEFGADMQLFTVNEGPVTILLDSTKRF